MIMRTAFYLLIFIIYYNSLGQVYPGDLTITSQNQIDSFNYTQVNGTLIIDESSSGNIINLDGLSTLTVINGGLSIANNSSLISLNGLDNLISIGSGPIDFYGYGIGLNIENNNSLTNINALSSLTSIGSNLYIVNNPSLINLNGLQGITTLNGNLDLAENINLTTLNGLNNLTSVNGIGFFGGGFNIYQCDSLITLEGLDNLVTIAGALSISSNNSLTSFLGLNSLTTITLDISIGGNESLENLNGLQNLTDINGSLDISLNNDLLSLTGLNNVDSIIGNLSIKSNYSLVSLEGLENLIFIGGFLEIGNIIDGYGYVYPGNIVLTSLNLNNLTSIGEIGRLYGQHGFLRITGCNSLTTLAGLENLHTIQPEYYYSTDIKLEIGSNSAELNLYNPQLSDFCGIQRLITYGEITSSTCVIANNAYNPTIPDIESLNCTLSAPSQTVFKWRTATNNGTTITETINDVTTTFTGNNPTILDVSVFTPGQYSGGGFDNVIQASSNSNVTFNFSEPVDVVSIMTSNDNYANTHTFTPIGGNNEIVTTTRFESGTVFLNWQGVTSFNVTTSGSYFGFDELKISPNTALSAGEYSIKDVAVYPNPAKTLFFIEGQLEIEKALIFNSFGKLIKTYSSQPSYEISEFSSGTYYVKIDTNNGFSIKKLIVE